MPNFAPAPDGTRLAWQADGSGPGVLLVAGLALDTFRWTRIASWLTPSYTVIRYSNRGVGESEPGSATITIGQLVSDAVSVLDAAGQRKVHLVGASLAAIVAQQLAVSHPERFMSLTLLNTLPGGDNALRPPRSIRDALTTHYSSAEAMFESVKEIVYSAQTISEHAERIEEDLASAGPMPPERVWRDQYNTAAGHDMWDRLPSITIPTLVVAGTADRVVPPGNAELIASRIPKARLERVKDAGHRLDADAPNHVRRLLLEFLADATSDAKPVAPASDGAKPAAAAPAAPAKRRLRKT